MENIGEKIYKLRKAVGLSQEELAEKIGVSRQTIYRWESNSVQPDADNTKLLCEVFSVPKSYFYDELAFTASNDESHKNASEQKKNKVKLALIIGLIINSIILVVLLFFSVLVGLSVFSPNTGDIVGQTSNLEKDIFITVIIFLGTFCLLEIGMIIYLLKIKKSK